MKTTPCIFNDNDLIIQQDTAWQTANAVKLDKWNVNKQFFSINPYNRYYCNRKKENISVMKNFLFEFDSIPLENQKTLFKEYKDIISMATYSGNKSIHFIIQIEDIPNTNDEYKYIWNMIKDRYFPLADKQCNDTTRLSRTPNAERENGMKQLLIWNTLQPLDIKWRGIYNISNEIKIMSNEYRKTIPITRNKTLTYEAECVLNGNYPKGERDEIIRKGVPYLFYNGYTLDETLENNMNTRANPDTIKNFWRKLESN